MSKKLTKPAANPQQRTARKRVRDAARIMHVPERSVWHWGVITRYGIPELTPGAGCVMAIRLAIREMSMPRS